MSRAGADALGHHGCTDYSGLGLRAALLEGLGKCVGHCGIVVVIYLLNKINPDLKQ